VSPRANDAMGRMPTEVAAGGVMDPENPVLPGLYAAGECACVSVHGANRLGTNSLLDLVVFGRRAGIDMARYCREADLPPLPSDPAGPTRERIEQLLGSSGKEVPAVIRAEMQEVMMDHVGVFRERA